MSTPSPALPPTEAPALNGEFLTGYGLNLDSRRARGWAGPGPQSLAAESSGLRPEILFSDSSLLPFHFLRTGDLLGRLVVKIRRADGACGTGFLVAPDIVLTNHHVLPTEVVAAGAIAVADFEAATPRDQPPRNPVEVRLDPALLFFTGKDLDFTFCGVDGLQGRGAIAIDRSEPQVGPWEAVNIIQHPRGRPKEVAIRDNQVIKADGVVVQYVCDTEPGSSGSPVFDNDWRLMALHHASVVAERPSLRPSRGLDSDPHFLNEGIRLVALALWIESDAAESLLKADGGCLEALGRVRSLFRGADPRAGLFGARGRSAHGRSSAEFVAEPWKHEGEVLDVAFWDLHALRRSPLDSVVEFGPIMNALGMDIWLLADVSMARARTIAEHLDTCFQRSYSVVELAGDGMAALVRHSRSLTVRGADMEAGLTARVRLWNDPSARLATVGVIAQGDESGAETDERRIARLQAAGGDWLVFGRNPGRFADDARPGVWSASGRNGGIAMVRPEGSCVASLYLAPGLKSRNPEMRPGTGGDLIDAAAQVAGRGPIAARLVLCPGSA